MNHGWNEEYFGFWALHAEVGLQANDTWCIGMIWERHWVGYYCMVLLEEA